MAAFYTAELTGEVDAGKNIFASKKKKTAHAGGFL